MKKWILPLLIGLIIGCIIGVLLGLFTLDILNISPNREAKYGILEIVYYLVAPIGVLATLLAVIVALFGNEFKNYLFREKSFSTVSSFTEILKDEDDANPQASRYECNLMVKNNCGREITDCCISLVEIAYGESDTSKMKKIALQNRIPIFWKFPDVEKRSLTPDETATITLLKITPDISQSKSDSSESTSIPRQLSIIGYKNLNPKYTKKGCWKLTYCVSNSHRELERFDIIVRWSGEWKNREKEMDNEASIEMNRILK